MVVVDFDPIKYLELDIPDDKKAIVNQWLYREIANFILERYLQEVDSDVVDRIDNYLTPDTTIDDLYDKIIKADENFDEAKIKYLKEFKENLDMNKIKEMLL